MSMLVLCLCPSHTLSVYFMLISSHRLLLQVSEGMVDDNDDYHTSVLSAQPTVLDFNDTLVAQPNLVSLSRCVAFLRSDMFFPPDDKRIPANLKYYNIPSCHLLIYQTVVFLILCVLSQWKEDILIRLSANTWNSHQDFIGISDTVLVCVKQRLVSQNVNVAG